MADNKKAKEVKAIKDVMTEETSRGTRRKHVDTKARKKNAERLKECKDLLNIGTEAEFKQSLLDAGIPAGSPRFLEALKIWREYAP